MTFLATISTIVLGYEMMIAGVPVTRTSLFGYEVAGQVFVLEAKEAASVLEASVAPVQAPVVDAAPVAPAVPAAAPSARPISFFAVVVDVVRGLQDRSGLNLRPATVNGHERVAVSCSAGKGCSFSEHAMRSAGLCCEVDGSTVTVIAV